MAVESVQLEGHQCGFWQSAGLTGYHKILALPFAMSDDFLVLCNSDLSIVRK